MPSRSNSQSNSQSTAARKGTEPKAKTGLRARLGTDSDSSSSDDDMEALRRGIREKNKAKAEMAAKIDALMQTDAAEALRATVLTPLEQERASAKEARASKAAATKVDFFTMVRGED